MITGLPHPGHGKINPKTLAPPTRPPAWSLSGPLICDRFPGVARHSPLADRPGRAGRAGELPGNSAQAAPLVFRRRGCAALGNRAGPAAGGGTWSRGVSLRLAGLGRHGHRSAAAFLRSSRGRCSAAVALLCSQRSPLSPAHHCQARAWASRFRAATSAGFPPKSSSWAECAAGGIGPPSVPGSGRSASGRRVRDGIGVFSSAGGDRCGSLDRRQRAFAMGWGLALGSELAPRFAAGHCGVGVAMFRC
jgi:hypothetical protein